MLALPPELIRRLQAATRWVALTGAGVSAESGIPTFREAMTGLWSQYRPEDLATPEAFRANPRRVWEWYAMRRETVGQAQPNAAHQSLATLESHVPGFTLVTQNVDGLHQRAGSRRIVELHGNLRRVKCSREGTVVEGWTETGEVPPRCAHCGALLRPDVVWFGEDLPAGVFEAARQATEQSDLFLCIGTSALVYPAASLPFAARKAGATVVEINPDPTPLSTEATHVLRGPAGQVLPQILEAVLAR